MTRSRARQIALQISFAASSSQQDPSELCDEILTEEYFARLSEEDDIFKENPGAQESYIRQLTQLIADHREQLDEIISGYSSSWKINRISPMTKEILRCALCEILYVEDVPESVAINEAVELTKRFAEEDSGAFVNGILGKYVKDMKEQSRSDE